MPKLLHTFCCCVVRPNTKSYKKSNQDETNNINEVNTSSVITQVTKNSENSALTSTVISRLNRLKKLKQSSSNFSQINNNDNNNNNTNTNINSNTNTNTNTNTNNNNGNLALDNVNNASSSATTITSPMSNDVSTFKNCFFETNKQLDKNFDSFLLPPIHFTHHHHGKKCLIVDLDETLVHSSFKPVKNADFIIPVEIDNVVRQVYVLKRPYADEFLKRIGVLFECVLFTASLAKYANPVADLLDRHGAFTTRLFRESCVIFEGTYVKDLDRLGRDLEKVVIIDNSPASYAFHPENALPIQTWFDDPHDCELLDMLPILEDIANCSNIYSILCGSKYTPSTESTTTTASTQLHTGTTNGIISQYEAFQQQNSIDDENSNYSTEFQNYKINNYVIQKSPENINSNNTNNNCKYSDSFMKLNNIFVDSPTSSSRRNLSNNILKCNSTNTNNIYFTESESNTFTKTQINTISN